MRLIYGERTDPGLVRPSNQDSYLIAPLDLPAEAVLLVVADGMGGYDGGEVASQLAVERVRDQVLAGAAEWAAQGRVAEGLVEAILQANQAILAAQLEQPKLSSMGTTLTAILVAGERLYVGHVGDSKAFLISPDRAVQITSDHNVPGELLQSGHLTREQAAVHPQRHMLTRALGVQDDLQVEQLTLEWQVGQMLLLCTDGLSNLVPLPEIQQMASQAEPAALTEQLVALANSRGGHDNITVLAARWEG